MEIVDWKMSNLKYQISNNNVIVSIVCITYNHAPFIRKALDGFLMQKTDFPFEIILAEDCSTDGTRAICEEYASMYPDKINYIYRDHNVGYNENEYEAMCAANGQYVAYCEGDDYWTDPLKLQKQIDFLESHSDYSVCWHRCKHFNAMTREIWDDACAQILPEGSEGMDIDMDTYFAGWYTQPLTMVFRKDALDLSLYHSYKYFRDMQQIYHLLMKGRGYLFSFYGGVRNIHGGGICSSLTPVQYCDVSLPIDKEFYWKTLANGPKKNYLNTLDKCVFVYNKTTKLKALRCAIVRFIISGHPRGFVRHMKLIFCK